MTSRPSFHVLPQADVCRFCERLRKEARALLGTDVHELAICDACIDLAGRILAEKRARDAQRTNAVGEVQPDLQCSFCDAHKRDVEALVAGPHVYLCSACIDDATAFVVALSPVSRRDLVVCFDPRDTGTCDFCGKAHREVKALLGTKVHQMQICDECVQLCGEIEAGTTPPRRAPTRAADRPTVDDQIASIVGRFREGPLAGDEVAYNELRPKATRSNLPRTYDGFRCSFCDVHWRDVDLIRGPRQAFICDACVTDALAVVRSGAETAVKGVDDLIREHAETPITTSEIPERVLEIVNRENVDEVMRALSDEMREVVVAYVQTTFASGVELVYAGNRVRSRERNELLCDWVRRAGRFHFPRRADEPSIGEIRARLDPPSGFEVLRSEPFRILRYVNPHNVDRLLAKLDADVRDIVVAWAKEALAGDGPVTGWRRRPGAVDAMRDWLRRHPS